VSAGDRYATPAAFRRALTDRLKVAAREGRWTLQQLQRQVAYDRLLERLYLIDDGWIRFRRSNENQVDPWRPAFAGVDNRGYPGSANPRRCAPCRRYSSDTPECPRISRT
jgi:hypothetical protein